MLEERVRELKEIIAGSDGRNAADARFARAVDALVAVVYERIGAIADIPTRALFDLFVIKVLYVERGSRHADVIEYLGALLDGFLFSSALYPQDDQGRPRRLYFSDMLDDEKRPRDVENVFEAYRQYADRALFVAGVFPSSAKPRRRRAPGMLRGDQAPQVDGSYYVSTGKTMYRMAARDDHASCAHQPDTLTRLADCFEIYVDALNEMSQRYITGFDMEAISDRMLDAFNRYRQSGDNTALDDARRYAAILTVDGRTFPKLFTPADPA